MDKDNLSQGSLTSGQNLCKPLLYDHLLFALLMPVYWACCLAAAMPFMLTNT